MFTLLTEETYIFEWMRYFVSAFLADCTHDLKVVEGSVHERYRLYGHFLKCVAINAFTATAQCLCMMRSSILDAGFWVHMNKTAVHFPVNIFCNSLADNSKRRTRASARLCAITTRF